MAPQSLIDALIRAVPGAAEYTKGNRPAVSVPVESFSACMQALRTDKRFAFDFLMDHMAIDWVEADEFEVLYQLFSTVHGHELMVSVRLPRRHPVIPTVSAIWPIAEWQEREVFDLFGIQYDDHPDLRRLFLEDDWQGYPLRKDYQDAHTLRKPD